jgi:hypothetical protein
MDLDVEDAGPAGAVEPAASRTHPDRMRVKVSGNLIRKAGEVA